MEAKQIELNYAESQHILEAFAYAFGSREFNLKDGDFVVRYRGTKKYNFRIMGKTGGVLFLIFTHEPDGSPMFLALLRRALKLVKMVKESEPGKAVDLLDSWQKRKQDINDQFKIPVLLPKDEIVEREKFTVSVYHKGTGLIVEKECKIGKVQETRLACWIELSELVDALKKKMAEKDEQAKQTTPAIR
jgi:hypothetical protein